MDGIVARFGARVPLLANMVEGGRTPLLDAAALQAVGYRLAIFPGGTVRALSRLLGEYYGSLKAPGGTGPFLDRIDRKSVVSGKSVSVRVDPGGRRTMKKK